ncbi:hypothetical protein BBF96_13155 [Anoxybacter fermentans]|uniref:Uncharacterized protein n=1 Tax=Anoxybacter fermentans TaxID=1323375 RepID=A0A3Q9HRR8_9FIRM|nr:hypothetical protein [Anoxybacter fermentans]AZR74265.1 hypothetical protein BBF96_13155 [Anoxybacter fermentans]
MKNNPKYSVRDFCFYFTEAYLALHERGLITEEQLEKVINLLDRLEDYPPDLFEERLKKIFD